MKKIIAVTILVATLLLVAGVGLVAMSLDLEEGDAYSVGLGDAYSVGLVDGCMAAALLAIPQDQLPTYQRAREICVSVRDGILRDGYGPSQPAAPVHLPTSAPVAPTFMPDIDCSGGKCI